MLVEEAGSFRKKVDDQRSGLRNQLRSTETALARWQAAFEAGEHIDVVAPRLRELQTKRLEMTATLTGLSDLAPPPKQLASEKTIRRFQETIRDIFISNDTTVTKSYLRFLVDRIIVHEGRIEIRAKPEHAAAMMAAGEGDGPAKGVVNHPEAVLAKGGRWLPTPAATQTAS